MVEFAMAIRLKGLVPAESLAQTTGLTLEETLAELGVMVEAGQVAETGRGFKLTPSGQSSLDDALSRERQATDAEQVAYVYESFCNHNDSFKQLVTDWQMREVDGAPVLNDHADPNYDAAVLQRLDELDSAVGPVFARAVGLVPRLERYQQRFASALAAVRAGDSTMLASPLKDSYHTVWFEIHEELILLCGRTRADEAAAGRGA